MKVDTRTNRKRHVNLYDLAKDTSFTQLVNTARQWWEDRKAYKLRDWLQTNWFATGGVTIGVRRKWTPIRVALHILYWYVVAWRNDSGLFARILVDPGKQADPALISVVQNQHFWTAFVLFYVLGEWVLPKIIYREFTIRQLLGLGLGLFVVYTVSYLSCRIVFLYIADGHFAYVPRYVRVRAELFEKSVWASYTDPLIVWFLWAHTFSYTFEPLLFKMGRDIHAWAHQFVEYERDLADLRARQAALEQENTKKELSLLRSQLHPHFLFNALNNIYALVRRTDQTAGRGVTNLADLMRYTLYRSQAKLVTLEEEVAFLQKYIDVEQLRRQDNRQITTQIDIAGYETYQIPPLLMISYIENAIKHGLNRLQEGGYVHVTLHISSQNRDGEINTLPNRKPNAGQPQQSPPRGRPAAPYLYFHVENTMPAFGTTRSSPLSGEAPALTPDSQSGIGLANTRRRLDLLYSPHEWSLSIQQQTAPARPDSFGALDLFTVDLAVALHEPDTDSHWPARAGHQYAKAYTS
jgi:two-component system, LytTR family, sensor kinase